MKPDELSDLADLSDSKQYNYLYNMANNCPQRDEWITYLATLSASTFHWQQIIIADPAVPTKFISNLVEIFDRSGGVSGITGLNYVHFKIGVAAAAVFSKPLLLRRNEFATENGLPTVPDRVSGRTFK